jgi:hypothetical protein
VEPEEKVVIADGAEWCWNQNDLHFAGAIQNNFRRHGPSATARKRLHRYLRSFESGRIDQQRRKYRSGGIDRGVVRNGNGFSLGVVGGQRNFTVCRFHI